MLTFIIGICGILLTILLVVGIHEFGHFIVARLVGVKVLRFSIGFGKALYRFQRKNGTEYVIAAIPLGGYVKMLDESEGKVPADELHLAYNQQPIYKRFLIVIAGPLFNILFSLTIYWFLFMAGIVTFVPLVGKVLPHSIAAEAGLKPNQEITHINTIATPTWENIVIRILNQAGDTGMMKVGILESKTHKPKQLTFNLAEWHLDDLKPEPLESLGITPYEPPTSTLVEKIQPQSDAFNKLLKNDKIIAVGNKKVNDWSELAKIILSHPNETLLFTIKRQNKTLKLPITLGTKKHFFAKETGFLGMTPQFEWPKELLRVQKWGPAPAFTHALSETQDLVSLNLIILKKLVTGKISIKSLGGPITIFESAGTALNNGTISFLSFLAFLSIAIGVINILPIPGLDGGHVLFQLMEFISRRPVPLTVQLLFFRLGIIFLLMVMAQAVINDVLRLS